LLGPFRLPTQINFAMLRDAISKIQVDKALVRNASFFGHFFEVLDDILAEPNRYRFLEFRRIGIFPGLHS